MNKQYNIFPLNSLEIIIVCQNHSLKVPCKYSVGLYNVYVDHSCSVRVTQIVNIERWPKAPVKSSFK